MCINCTLNLFIYLFLMLYTVAVLAIKPIVYHVFLNSSVIMDTNYAKELETQRDVLFAMLLKLMHIPCVSITFLTCRRFISFIY